MEINKGGKRMGAGRKPFAEKREPITVYVKNGFILKYGVKEKARKRIYDLIESDTISETYKESYDAPKFEHIPHDEPKQWEQPKQDYFATAPIQVPLTKRQVYINDLNECRSYDEIKKVILRSKSDDLSSLDTQMINLHVTTVMEEKGIESY